MPLFGAHMSIAGGYHLALEIAHAHGCDTVQLFTKSPSQWASKPISDKEALLFRTTLRRLKLRSPVGHDSYLINLASPDETLYRRSIEAFIDEVARAEMLGLKYLVTHPGAHMGIGEEPGLDRVVVALDEVHRRCPNVRVKVLLETTAGQGTCIGYRFEHLRHILKRIAAPRRLGVCVDTCHILAGGYSLATPRDYEATMREFDRLIGFGKLRVFHLNDSVKPLGCRVDRHAGLGLGHVGLSAFRRLVNDSRFRDRPMNLETPKESAECDDMDSLNLAILRKLVRGARSASKRS